MIVTQRGVVDITPEYNRALRPIFCVSEGDKTSRQIVLTVMQSGETFLIPSGATVYIVGKKPDNNVFTYRCSYSGSDVTFNITDQMSAASGIVLCELQINLSGEVLGSANFVYWTEPTPLENGSYSESDLNIFLEAIAGAERLDNFYAGIEDIVAQAVEQIQIKPGQTVIDPTLRVNGAAADAAATGNAVRSFLEALVTETTPSAAIATCDDAAGGLPLKKLTANIVPTQAGSGDPSPGNVRPISGYTGVTVTRTGKNLLPNTGAASVTSNGITFTKNADGSVTASGTATSDAQFSIPIEVDTIPYNTQLYFSGCPSGGSSSTYHIYVWDKTTNARAKKWDNSTYSGNDIGTTANNEVYYENGHEGIFVIRVIKGVTVNNITFCPMIRLATETDATFKPYNGATYPVTFPTAAGTVYGGTLTVNSDGSGTLTVDKAMLTANSFTAVDKATSACGLHWADFNSTNVAAGESFSSMLLKVDTGWTSTTPCYIMTSGQRIRVYCTETTIADFKAAYADLQIVYPLATPTTYALSAVQVVQMLAGLNNIWTDAAGTVSGEYYASTALYVQKIVNAQKGMIAGVEEAMTATQNYSVGDLMIVGDALYKATAAISSGAALVVGTNISQTTVAEQLIALANA